MKSLFAAAVLAVMTIVSPAGAQTVGYAEAIDILSESCGADINRYCKNATLANWGIGDCLNRNRANISQQCAANLVAVQQSLDAREAAQQNAMKACNRDVQRLCKLVKPGRGHILNCLLTAERSVSDRCNQAITNAGWR